MSFGFYKLDGIEIAIVREIKGNDYIVDFLPHGTIMREMPLPKTDTQNITTDYKVGDILIFNIVGDAFIHNPKSLNVSILAYKQFNETYKKNLLSLLEEFIEKIKGA